MIRSGVEKKQMIAPQILMVGDWMSLEIRVPISQKESTRDNRCVMKVNVVMGIPKSLYKDRITG